MKLIKAIELLHYLQHVGELSGLDLDVTVKIESFQETEPVAQSSIEEQLMAQQQHAGLPMLLRIAQNIHDEG